MTEDHGLSNGDGSVDVTERLELLLLAVAQNIILFDGIQSLLLSLQFNDVGIGDDALSEVPNTLLKRGWEQQHLADFGQHPVWQRCAEYLADNVAYGSAFHRTASTVYFMRQQNWAICAWAKMSFIFSSCSAGCSPVSCIPASINKAITRAAGHADQLIPCTELHTSKCVHFISPVAILPLDQ